MDNLRVLTTFIRIADTGSFRKAAHELGITPQGASNHIRQLEDWVGVRLFNRTTRKVNLTPEGMSFYDTCSVAMHTIEKGVETLHQTSERIVGNVRVAAPYGIGWRFVAPALTRFLELYPDVNVELVV